MFKLTVGVAFMVSAAVGSYGDTGASLAWTSDDPVVVKARNLIETGQFGQAEQQLRAAAGPTTDSAHAARAEMLETIRRIRLDYSLSADELLARVRRTIPDATAADLERWRLSGGLQHRRIDGQIAFFGREPVNLFRFCAEARARRAASPTTAPAVTTTGQPSERESLDKHIVEVLAAAREGQAFVQPVRHHAVLKVTVRPNRPGAKVGSQVRCWLPFPQEHPRQREIKLIRTLPAEHQLSPSGNTDSGPEHRCVYLEQRVADPASPMIFEEEFEFTSYAHCPGLSDDQARPLPAGFDARWLSERPPHIVFTPELKAIVNQVVGEEQNPLVRARRIFEWLDREIRYCAECEYATIPSLTRKALATRRGDCGVQAMLFISMCRCAGIPARWQSGWQTRPGESNLHDWAEIYIEPWGWLPVDPSYGSRTSESAEVRWFYFGHLDSYRMIVNLDYGAAFVPAKPSMRSEPADFQRGEIEMDGRNLYFDEWTYDMTLTYPS